MRHSLLDERTITDMIVGGRMTSWVIETMREQVPVELSFDGREIRTLCECNNAANDCYGVDRARLLRDAVAELRAAPAVADIADYACRTSVVEDGVLGFSYGDDIKILFAANHVRCPLDETGGVDWEQVSNVKILRVEVIHG